VVAVAVEFGAAGGSTWTALTCDVFGLGWNRGASEDRGVLAVPESGELVAYLIDPARDLDPANGSSIFAGAWDIGARFRVTLGGVVAFSGRVDSIAHDLDPPKVVGTTPYPLARVGVVDGVALAAAVDTMQGGFLPESTSARIGHLLDVAGIATGVGQRDIEAGGEQLQGAVLGLTNDVWSDLLAVVQNELGSIEFRADGSVRSRIRSSTWATSAPVLHLGCEDPDSSAELALNSVRLMTERSTVRNRINAARAGGQELTVEDPPSQLKYGLRATQRDDLRLVDDGAVDAWARFALNRSKAPTRGLENVSVSATDAGVALIEAVPLFTGRVHVYQGHYGPTIDRVVRLLGVAWDVDADANATATLTLGTDSGLISTARTLAIDFYQQWVDRMGSNTGPVGWIIDGAGALRTSIAGEVSPSTGGVDSITFAWTSDL
jgi:hypothetical protein